MAGSRDHKQLLKKLKKQVSVLQRREEQSKNKLKAALTKLRKLTRTYKTKLASNVRIMKVKIGQAQSSTYAKVANDIEKQLMKGIVAKGKKITSAIGKLEKKHISKLTKGIVKKSKKKYLKPSKTSPSTIGTLKSSVKGKAPAQRKSVGKKKGSKK